ncbi:MAG: 50S ribosomal protein L32 [Thermoflexibacter sp.]
MAHPKSKISKTRRDKRRTHDKCTPATIATCPTTGEAHLYHRAHWHEGKLYYKGKVVMEKEIATTDSE